LREGWSAIKPEHLIVIMLAAGAAKPGTRDLEHLASRRIFYASRSKPVYTDSRGHPVADLDGKPVILVSGIARPKAFEATCLSAGLNVVASVRFDDHHWYGASDTQRLKSMMERYGSTNLVTTEKDILKMPDEIRHSAVVARTDILMENSGGFAEALGGLRG
jgi:tetraacyldisaccharide 4'-kinase